MWTGVPSVGPLPRSVRVITRRPEPSLMTCRGGGAQGGAFEGEHPDRHGARRPAFRGFDQEGGPADRAAAYFDAFPGAVLGGGF